MAGYKYIYPATATVSTGTRGGVRGLPPLPPPLPTLLLPPLLRLTILIRRPPRRGRTSSIGSANHRVPLRAVPVGLLRITVPMRQRFPNTRFANPPQRFAVVNHPVCRHSFRVTANEFEHTAIPISFLFSHLAVTRCPVPFAMLGFALDPCLPTIVVVPLRHGDAEDTTGLHAGAADVEPKLVVAILRVVFLGAVMVSHCRAKLVIPG